MTTARTRPVDTTTSVDPTPSRTRLSARAARMATSLTQATTRRVYLRDLWTHLDGADPTLRSSAIRRATLADTLTELAAASVLTFPSDRSWDRTERPHLPRFITIPGLEAPSEPTKTIVWHPTLAWVTETRLTGTQRGHMVAVNTWLHSHRDPLIVPLRERSLEIFGDEKTLDRLLTTGLFGPGRLTPSLLRARRVAPRLTTEAVGDGDVLLVVENSDTFDSLSAVLAEYPGRIGVVGWGAGAGFEHSVLSIPRLGRVFTEIRYFGDLDKKGLEIPRTATRLATMQGLPAVLPAERLYEALIANGTPQRGQPRVTAQTAAGLVGWLPTRLRPEAAEHLMAGTRLAQEAVGLALIRRLPTLD